MIGTNTYIIYTFFSLTKKERALNISAFKDGLAEVKLDQRTVYNGQKRLHSLKFQSVTLLNGFGLFGPVGKYLISYLFLVPTITKSRPCPFCDTFVSIRSMQLLFIISVKPLSTGLLCGNFP